MGHVHTIPANHNNACSCSRCAGKASRCPGPLRCKNQGDKSDLASEIKNKTNSYISLYFLCKSHTMLVSLGDICKKINQSSTS